MERQQVESSNIKSIGYDPQKRKLEVEFLKGGIYQYSPITAECYQQLMAAESKGTYLTENIKNNELVFCKKVN